MKALVLNELKNLDIRDWEKPVPNEGEVLVKLKASAINHRELWIQKGLYPGMKLPCILGADGSGIVVSIGDGIDSSWLEKEVVIYPAYDWGNNEESPSRNFRVLGMPDPGTMAEYISVPVESLEEKPSYLSWVEAAALPVAGLTAWRALRRHGGIKHGDKLLITGIGGGVAQAGLALACAMGAEVYVSSSSKEKIESSKKIGASGGVNYKDQNWNLQLKEMSNGIDMVLDSSPSAVLDEYFKFMNYGGKIVTYGSTGSPKTTISISKFFLRHIQFIGTAMGSPSEFKALIDFMKTNKIKPLIHASFSFDEALIAFDVLRTGQQIGKIVLEHK
jgi:NADPH:quinone reductase-like Zn-dependent oxidoreductase